MSAIFLIFTGKENQIGYDATPPAEPQTCPYTANNPTAHFQIGINPQYLSEALDIVSENNPTKPITLRVGVEDQNLPDGPKVMVYQHLKPIAVLPEGVSKIGGEGTTAGVMPIKL